MKLTQEQIPTVAKELAVIVKAVNDCEYDGEHLGLGRTVEFLSSIFVAPVAGQAPDAVAAPVPAAAPVTMLNDLANEVVIGNATGNPDIFIEKVRALVAVIRALPADCIAHELSANTRNQAGRPGLWTEEARTHFRQSMRMPPISRCPVCCVKSGDEHFPGCSQEQFPEAP